MKKELSIQVTVIIYSV